MTSLVSTENIKDGTRCIFLLPKHYTIPVHLSRATPDECALAFQIANSVIASKEKYCLEEYSSSITKDIEREHEQALEKLLAQHKKEYRQQEIAMNEQEKRLLKQITDLEVQLQKASSSEESIHKRYESETERRVLQQKENDLLYINDLKEQVEKLRSETKELHTKLETRLSIQNNSSKKGREGEESFEELVRERKGWILNYSGDRGHSADYHTRLHDIHIRFEVKNYTHVVPSKEVEKMRKDLREHPETDVGVFISLNTGITSIPSISLEWTPTNQLILFIPIFFQQDIDFVLHSLDLLFQTVKPYRTILSSTAENQQYPLLKERVDRALIYARNGITRIVQSMSQFVLDLRALQEKIEDMTSHTKTNLAAQKEELQSMIAILSGQDVAFEFAEESPDALPKVHEEKKTARNRRKVVSPP